jgi:hypothetical protein
MNSVLEKSSAGVHALGRAHSTSVDEYKSLLDVEANSDDIGGVLESKVMAVLKC